MAIGGKIIQALTTTVKMNDAIAHLTESVKNQAKEIRDLDRRLIRLEILVEMAEKHRRLANV